MSTTVLAEFPNAPALVEATRAMSDAGHEGLDAFTPYMVKEVFEPMKLRRSPIPAIVLLAALAGTFTAYWFQSWMASVDYPLNVGGRTLNAVPAWVPIMFELTVLFGSFGAFLGLLALARLPQLYSPPQQLEAFRSATVSGFWLSVPVGPATKVEDVESRLRELGATMVSRLPDEGPR